MTKKIILLAFLISNLLLLFGQEKLRVEYEVIPSFEPKTNLGFEMKSIPTLFELIVDKKESEYNFIPRVDNSQNDASSGISASYSITSSGVLYKNTDEKRFIEESELDGKKYLIHGELPSYNWQISRDSKEIAGFQVLKATTIVDGEDPIEITAWYAPKLSFKNGPDSYWGLPGLILELETATVYSSGDKEGIKYVALKVETVKSKKSINQPTKGMVVNKEQFRNLQEENWKKQMEFIKSGVDKD